MQTDWPLAIDFVLKQEGAYTVDPKDPGGETVWGIARTRQPQWDGWKIVDAKKILPDFPNNFVNDLAFIESVKNFYLENFWKPCKCDMMPSQLAIIVFDMAVNQGVTTAIKILQRTLKVAPDGIIGQQTISAIMKYKPRTVTLLLANRLVNYHDLMIARPNLNVFALNWFHRTIELAKLIL